METSWSLNTSWVVAPENMSAIFCDNCGTYATLEQNAIFDNGSTDNCRECGAFLSYTISGLSVRSDNAQFLDAAEVRKATWFHATLRNDWVGDLTQTNAQVHSEDSTGEPSLMVHVGTADAALTRLIDAMKSQNQTEGYVYELRIKDSAEIHDLVYDDANETCPEWSYQCGPKGYSTGVTRYVNRYESIGSISLLINSEAFEVVNVTTV